MKKILLATAFCAAFTSTAYAQTITEGWGGEASVSGSKTTGNTDTTDIGLALHLKKNTNLWQHSFDVTYDLGKADGDKNKDRAYIGYQLDRMVNDRLYIYGNANYFTDGFGPFKFGHFVGAGIGYQVVNTQPMQWALEGGVGYRTQKTRSLTLADLKEATPAKISEFARSLGYTKKIPSLAELTLPSVKKSEFALRAGSEFDYKINESVAFFNDSEIIWSKSDTYIWNEIGMTANLTGNLAARFSFRIDKHSDVPFGFKKTDTLTRAALVYTLN
ncbi:MAG: DUF481 domain-containing protein [Robiginitomaculum sp.]